MGETLDAATGTFLLNDKSPSRKCGELDNRGSHFYLAMYWAQELAAQNDDEALKTAFTNLSHQLSENEAKIVAELNEVQGQAMDIGGYYNPNDELGSKAMRPSHTLNSILEGFKA